MIIFLSHLCHFVPEPLITVIIKLQKREVGIFWNREHLFTRDLILDVHFVPATFCVIFFSWGLLVVLMRMALGNRQDWTDVSI